MLTFEVQDMTCGHCASTITRAVTEVDQDAKVAVDLSRRLVTVESAKADAATLGQAIAQAGYTPVPMRQEPASTAKPAADVRGGCGSGCGCS